MSELDDYETVPLPEFDALARSKSFADGPYVTEFGDRWYDPYVPTRTVWGTTLEGRKIKSERPQ